MMTEVQKSMLGELARAEQRLAYGERLKTIVQEELERVREANLAHDDYQNGDEHGLIQAITLIQIEQTKTARQVASCRQQLGRNFNG